MVGAGTCVIVINTHAGQRARCKHTANTDGSQFGGQPQVFAKPHRFIAKRVVDMDGVSGTIQKVLGYGDGVNAGVLVDVQGTPCGHAVGVGGLR